jgi:hypothetical protein
LEGKKSVFINKNPALAGIKKRDKKVLKMQFHGSVYDIF